MSAINFDSINQAALACFDSLLGEWFPTGKREGHELKIGSISGEEGRSLSINTRTGVWKDYASGESGSDPISLYAAARGLSMGDAAKQLGDRLRTSPPPPTTTRTSSSDEWEAQPVAHPEAPEPQPTHYKFGKPSNRWTYRNADGALIGYVFRFNLPDGSKQIVPQAWCVNAQGRQCWRWKSFPKPRPLYGLDLLAQRPDAVVLVCEGEKTADAAGRLLPSMVCVSWPGGSQAVRHADWTPLMSRRVLIWPDNDAPGLKASCWIRGMIPGSRVIATPAGVPDGWDLADAERDGWTTERVREHILATKATTVLEPDDDSDTEHRAGEQQDIPEPTPEEIAAAYAAKDAPDETPATDTSEPDRDLPPFRYLGHNQGTFFYMPTRGRQIIRLSANEHRQNQLLQLADLDWWESMFAGKKGPDWARAANHLITMSYAAGIFSHNRIRGRGAWLESGNVVFHAGDQLWMDGKPLGLELQGSRHIYQLAEPFHLDNVTPLTSAEAFRIIELCERLSFAKPIYGRLLAGWCAIAPICGVMPWRPHIWISGPSSAGKSWVMREVVSRILGHIAFSCQSATTEAGIRQALGTDARPVLFDEAESENQRGQMRMSTVLELARQASSDDSPAIIKGSAGGMAQTYIIHSMFCFSSIGVAATMKADISRITQLELIKLKGGVNDERFANIKAIAADTVRKDGYAEAFRARSLRLAPIISTNARRFAKAVAMHLDDTRLGDQLGAMLAGAYSLSSTSEIDQAAADAWVAAQDWTGFVQTVVDTDENTALSLLLCHQLQVEDSDARRRTLSIAELIDDSAKIDNSQWPQMCHDTLLRNGVKVVVKRGNVEHIEVSWSNQYLARIYSDSPWDRKWGQQLARIEGAEKLAACRFRCQPMQRATRIPAAALGLHQRPDEPIQEQLPEDDRPW